MSYRLRVDRLSRYAEIRPFDGVWTLTGGREHATPFRTNEEALAAVPDVLAVCGEAWGISADDFMVTADDGLPMPNAEQHRDYVRRFYADTDVA